LQHLRKNDKVQQRCDDGCGNRLKADLPEAQQFFAKQGWEP